MPMRLSEEEVVTIRVLAEKGQNHCQIARTVGVTEGAVRYHLRRAAEGAVDGRSQRRFEAESMAAVIAAWHEERKDEDGRSTSSRCTSTWCASTATRAPTARCCATCEPTTRGRRSAPTGGWRRHLARRRRPTGASTRRWTWATVPSR